MCSTYAQAHTTYSKLQETAQIIIIKTVKLSLYILHVEVHYNKMTLNEQAKQKLYEFLTVCVEFACDLMT